MAIIPNVFNLSCKSIIDATGYLVDQRMAILLDSPVREILRRVHLMYVLRAIALPWFFSSQNVGLLLSRREIPDSYRYIWQFKETADRYRLPYLLVLLPPMQGNAWGPLPDRLKQDAVTYLDLSSIGKEFTREEYMASRFDPHASPAVHQRIGESLADCIANQPGYAH